MKKVVVFVTLIVCVFAYSYTVWVYLPHKEGKVIVLDKSAIQVIDGDTFYYDGKKYHLNRVDAPELSQPYGEESRRALEVALGGDNVEIIPVEEDIYGRTVADVRVNGEDLSLRLVREGSAWHYEGEQSELSEQFRLAQQAARDSKKGLFGSSGGKQEPRAYRKTNLLSDYQRDQFREMLRRNREMLGISYTPEYIKQLNDEISAEYNKPMTEEQKKIAPVKGVARTVSTIAGVGFAYEASGKKIDDIPTYELNNVLEYMREAFGYTAEDFVREGFKDPYDAAREYVKAATGIVRSIERKQKEFLKLPGDEQQERMREMYGVRWYSPAEIKQHVEGMSLEGVVSLAFLNGAEAKTVSTAVMMALSEIHGEDMHRSRLAQMSPKQARKAEKLWNAIRGK